MERSYTGFVDDRAAGAVEHLPGPHAARDIDIVYRARNLPYHIGHHGQLKHEIAHIVEPAARERGLRTDISTDIKDTKYGDAWFDFLASGRCVIGTESGSSALDPVGAIRRFEAEWRPSHPDATFEEFSALQEPGWDDYDFTAISPRLFEAAQTKTCQLLVEGAYDGILEAGDSTTSRCARDLSNLAEALERIARPGRDRGDGRARVGGPHRQRALLLRRLRRPRGVGRRRARRRARAFRPARRDLLAGAQRGQRRLCRRPHPHARGWPTAPRCATPRGPPTPCCADATPCGAEARG